MSGYFRTITLILILALATSPALAAVCATSCATESIMSTVNPDDISTMTNCHEGTMSHEGTMNHEGSMDKDKTKSTTEHNSCSMGAGCHFSQATSVDLSSKYALIDSSTISFPQFVTSKKSVDLSPPLKPPA